MPSRWPSHRAEGAGKAGRRLRPQHRAQWVERTHTDLTGTAETSRLSPHNGLRLIRALPGEAAFLAPVVRKQAPAGSARVAAPGPHDFTVRCRRFAGCKHLTPAAAIATRTTFRDDRETSLWWHGLKRNIVLICGIVKSRFGNS